MHFVVLGELRARVDDFYPHGLCGCWMTLHTDFYLVVLISAGLPQLYHDSTLVINLMPAYVYIQCSLEIKKKSCVRKSSQISSFQVCV